MPVFSCTAGCTAGQGEITATALLGQKGLRKWGLLVMASPLVFDLPGEGGSSVPVCVGD